MVTQPKQPYYHHACAWWTKQLLLLLLLVVAWWCPGRRRQVWWHGRSSQALLHKFWWPMIIVCNAHTTLLCWWEKPAPLEGIILNAPASWNGLARAVVQARRRGVASPDLPTLPPFRLHDSSTSHWLQQRRQTGYVGDQRKQHVTARHAGLILNTTDHLEAHQDTTILHMDRGSLLLMASRTNRLQIIIANKYQAPSSSVTLSLTFRKWANFAVREYITCVQAFPCEKTFLCPIQRLCRRMMGRS